MHRYLLLNGDIRNTSEPLISPGQIGYVNGWGVFSTLRVMDGVLFAYERHYNRMKYDAERMRVPFEYSADELHRRLTQLLEANKAADATLRVCVVRNRGGLFESPALARNTDLVAFTADLKDWGKGVKLSYVPNGRHGASPFAGAKITSWAQNLTWHEQAHENGFDEVILLNEEGEVSECTSANIFAIQKNRVLTPPLNGSGCLPGVTRAILLEEVEIARMSISEQSLSPSELESSDQIFITSTTRDLLPVLEIDGEPMPQDSATLGLLQEAFARRRSEYISRNARRNEMSLA